MPNTYNTTAAQTDRYTQTLCMFYGVYVVLTELRATEPAEDTYGHTLVRTGLFFAQLHVQMITTTYTAVPYYCLPYLWCTKVQHSSTPVCRLPSQSCVSKKSVMSAYRIDAV